MYRPLPGAGGGSSGPAYDDTALSGRIDDHDTRLLVLESDDGKTYSLTPIRDGESAQLRISLPFDIGADPFGTFGLAGYTADSAFIATVGGTDVVIPMTPATAFAEFANDLDVALRAGGDGAAEIDGGPNAWVLRISSNSAITIRANAASAFFGWAEESEAVAPGGAAFWQGGEVLAVPGDYPTIAAALEAAASRYALPDAKIEIIVADGTVDTTDFQLPDADLRFVTVRPETLDDGEVMASNMTVSGSAGAWLVTISLSAAEFARYQLGDVCNLYMDVKSTNANNNMAVGGWVVEGMGNNKITVRNTSRAGSLSPSSMWAKRMHVRIHRGTSLLVSRHSPVFRDIAFSTTTEIRVINLVGSGVLTVYNDGIKAGLCVTGGGVGIRIDDAGEVHGPFSCTGGLYNGLSQKGGRVVGPGFITNGSKLYDGFVSDASYVSIVSSGGLRPISCGNGGSGISMRYNTSANFSDSAVQGNSNPSGMIATGNARIVTSGQQNVEGYSPSANVGGNSNSYIQVL